MAPLSYVTKHCLFCGEREQLTDLYPQTFRDEDLVPSVFSARRATEHYHYRLVRCRCGLVFSREILPDEAINQLYAESSVTFDAYASVLRRDYWRPLARHEGAIGRAAAMEIGCSNGFFLEELQARGFKHLVGYEPSLEARQKASPTTQPFIRSSIFHGATASNELYDLICCFHTLDHVTEPAALVEACRQAIRPGALVYMVVHDVDAWSAKLLGERSPIFDIQHIYLFNKQTLARLFEAAGFQVMDIGNLVNSYPLKYWLHMFPMGARWKHRWSKLFDALRAGDATLRFPMGNLYILARAPASP